MNQASDIAARSEAASESTQVLDRPKRRQLSAQDFNKALMELGLQPTQENKDMASLMMKYGMELSKGNFEELLMMTRGKESHSEIESAIIAKSKGVLSKETLSSINDFLFNKQTITTQSRVSTIVAVIWFKNGIFEIIES